MGIKPEGRGYARNRFRPESIGNLGDKRESAAAGTSARTARQPGEIDAGSKAK